MRGGRFVLSAGAVNSAALLLASADEAHPSGLANSSDLVGRRFMMHHNAHVAAVSLRHRNDVTFQKTLAVNDWYLDGGDGYPLGSLQLIGKVQGVMIQSWRRLPLPRAGPAGGAQRRVAGDERGPAVADSRVRLDPAGRIVTDRRGVRLGDPPRAAPAGEGAAAGSRLRRGVHPVVRPQHEQPPVRHRRRREDPATSVLDPWCRSHDVANLWVVDGGFFPSSAAMNPALTIAAQALRVVAESELAA